MESNSSAEYVQKGLKAFGQGRIDDALLIFTKALELDPVNADVWNNRAICFRQLNKLEDALRDATAAVTIDSTQALFHSTRGTILTTLNRYQEAIEEFDAALIFSPLHPEYLMNKVVALRKAGHQRLALEVIKQVPSPDNSNPEILIYKGILFFELKEFTSAAEIFKAMRSTPQKKIAEHYLSMIKPG